MIVFGSAVTDPKLYERCALPGIERAREADSKVIPYQSSGSLCRNYNLILDQAKDLDDLEAVVLVHQDAEIANADFCAKLRDALADRQVGVVGAVGAVGVRNLAWWEGAVTWASFTHRYPEFGGGDFPGMSWDSARIAPIYDVGEVDSIDGFVMAISPWAVREIRFDEALGPIHGYDFDYCCQVRAAGKKVLTADFKMIHHHDLELLRNREAWVEAHIKIAEKWDGVLPGVGFEGGDWKQRARRAEAELGAEKLNAASWRYRHDAIYRVYVGMAHSLSWKMTRPLRKPRNIARRLRRRWRARSGRV